MHHFLTRRRPALAGLVTVLGLLAACADADPLEPLRPDAGRAAAAVVAAEFTGDIRIGVIPAATTITIGSEEAFVVRSAATGEEVLQGSGGEVVVSAETPPRVTSYYWLQVVYTTNQAYVDDWVARAAALAYRTMVEPHPSLPGKRLLLGRWPSSAGWGERVGYKETAISQGLASSDAFWRLISEAEAGRVTLAFGGVSTVADAPVVLEGSGLVRIGASRYRGVAEVGYNSGGTLAGINQLPIEQYLYGVVPRELPPVPYDELEAQKAQAVAARTYAMSGLGKRKADGYDLRATTLDQVYGGFDAEHPVSTRAVDGTAGVVATYGGVFAQTLYSSTSGGFLANNEDVYNSAPVAYLRGKPDAERGQAAEHVPSLEIFKRAANPTNLRAAANGDYEADWSRYHRWVVEWSATEMAEVLSASFGEPIGAVHEVRVTDRADHGRVRAIEFVTDVGTFVATKDQIRGRLRYVSATGAHAPLRSTLFYVEPVIEARSGTLTGWVAYGGGWGHGVGMSQTGAVGMAERGKSYEQILHHYYTGVELVRWY